MARRITLILLLCLLVATVSLSAWLGLRARARVRRSADDQGFQNARIGARVTQYLLERAVDNGILDQRDLFDETYVSTPQDPGRFHTRYDLYLDRNLSPIIDRFLDSEPVYCAYVLRTDGYVPVHGDPRQAKIMLDSTYAPDEGHDSRYEIPRSHHDGQAFLEYASPVYVRGKHWGSFRVGIPEVLVENQVTREVVSTTVPMLSFSAALAILIYVVVRRNLRPLARLREATGRMTDGDLTARCEVTGPVELADLAETLNTMASALEKREALLDRHKAELADRIEARTRQLQSANDHLRSILDQKSQAQQALHQSEQRYRQLIDNLGLGIAMMDRDYNVFLLNAAHERIFEQPASVAVGQPCYQVFLSSDEPCPNCPGAQAMTTGRPAEMERALRTRDGRVLEIRMRSFPTTGPDGEITGYLQIVEDVTESKRAAEEMRSLQEQLRQSQRLETVGTLAGGVAHDFNNILTPVLGYTEMAKTQLPSDSPVQEDLTQIITGVNRARDLVRQILAFSRQAEQDRKPVDLAAMAREVVTLLRPTLPAAVECELDASDVLPPVMADPTQMHQVLMNLCTNASQALRNEAGRIAVRVDVVCPDPQLVARLPGLRERRYVHAAVSDNGVGIEPAVLARIFEPFFTTRKAGGGSGLGLSVVHGIVTSHGGVIDVQSRPGLGATVDVYLPVADAVDVAESDTTPLSTGNGEHVLLVDDQEHLAHWTADMLRDIGYRVTVCTDASEALAIVGRNSSAVDAVVTDQDMPAMLGTDLSQRLRQLRANLPIVLLSGYGEDLTPFRLREVGIDVLAPKPIVIGDLARAVRQAMESHCNEEGVHP